jgi:hypothetical protein
VTLLFSREHYLAAAEAFLRGIERRLDAGLNITATLPNFKMKAPSRSSSRGTT